MTTENSTNEPAPEKPEDAKPASAKPKVKPTQKVFSPKYEKLWDNIKEAKHQRATARNKRIRPPKKGR